MIVKDIGDVTKLLPSMSKQFKFDEMRGFILIAENCVNNLIGNDYYDYLSNLSTPAGIDLDSIRLANQITAYKLFPLIAEGMTLQVSPSGTHLQKTETTTYADKVKYEVSKNRYNYLANQAANQYLKFLEKNSSDTNIKNLFLDKPIYAEKKCLFVYAPEIFDKFQNISTDYYLFSQIAPKMRLYQEQVIKPILQNSYYDDLMNKLKEGKGFENFTNADKAILPYLQALLIFGTLADNWEVLNLFISTGGALTFFENLSEQGSKGNFQKVYEPNLSNSITNWKNQREVAQRNLQNYLIENSTDFPLFQVADGTKYSYIYPETNQDEPAFI